MLIHRIAAQLYTAEALQTVEAGLDAGEDVTLAVSQSGRTLTAAAQFARRPRPTVYIVSGEDAADRAARSLAAYVGLAHVCRFPERKDYPWREQAPDDAVVAQRCEALGRIVRGDNCIMVASARALLRCVPPVESRYWESTTFAVGEEIPFDEVPQRLVGMGYTNAGAADAPGLFRVHGDTVEVFPAQEKAPVRIEFFGDEIDRIRRMVSSTGQTIGNEDSIEIFPCRELALTDEAVHNMHVALYRASQDDSKLAALLEMVDARIVTPELDRFLPVMYGQTVSPLAHVSGKALVVLSEPRSLFDDCLRAYEDIEARAGEAGIDRLDGLYVRAQQLDFGAQQRLNYVSLIRAGGAVTAELKIEQPAIAGSDNRFMTRIQEVVGKRYACVFAIPDRGARESMELTFGDEGITFEESLTAAPENAGAIGDRVRVAAADSADRAARQEAHASIRERRADALNARSLEAGAAQAAAGAAVPTISRGRVTFVDAALPQGVVVPDANLAVFSIADLNARMDANRARSRRKVDITQITFPFKPGDYVVHATHGIALFSEIARQEVGGKERDYFLLEYADGDKLYVPLEQVDRITRYVGPDGDKPRLTRLNTADWTRATNKARKNAKKLAFDLVDLYTRRSSITGIACPPDTPEQIEMEESFPYDETRDQLEAIADIKADMEAPKPMDRLLCGDVGFGKTEVALRAAFKCVDSGRQVMVLCPTTILAQQHYETFFERFAPFGLEVEVLSRFRTPAQQKRALICALKDTGRTVAMIGDGVNDVLALKDADCSIAMAAGSEAAQHVAQLVLLSSNFSAMPQIVKEGRRVINNIERSATLFLVKNIFSFVVSLVLLFAAMPYPLVPAQISLLSGLLIGVPSFLLTFEPSYGRVRGSFMRSVLLNALPGGLVNVVNLLAVMWIGSGMGLPMEQISTVCTLLAGTAGFMVLLFLCWPLSRWRFAIVAAMGVGFIGACVLLGPLFGLSPLSGRAWTLLGVFAAATPALMCLFVFLVSRVKQRLRRSQRAKHAAGLSATLS